MLRRWVIFFCLLLASRSYSQQLVKDINKIPGSQVRNNLYEQQCFKCGSYIYFVGNDTEHGRELWKTDGTAGGTQLVADLTLGPESGMQYTEMFCLNDYLYFRSNVLWKTNGSAADVVAIETPNQIAVFDNKIVFTSNSSLFSSAGGSFDREEVFAFPKDGDEAIVTSMFPGVSHLYILLTRYPGTGGQATSYELWAYDGTRTNLLKEFVTGNVFGLAAMADDKIVFIANDGIAGQEFWVSDGTEEGTELLFDAVTGPSGSSPSIIGSVAGSPILSTSVGTWLTGPTAEDVTKLTDDPMNSVLDRGGRIFLTDGTRIIKIDDEGLANEVATGLEEVKPLGALNSQAFFTIKESGTGNEIFYVEFASDNLILLKDINPDDEGSYARAFAIIEETQEFVFFADDGANGFELWKSNGVEAGTALLKNIAANTGDTNFSDFYVHNDKLYFLADDTGEGFYNKLWSSDGTDAGTAPVNEQLHSDLIFAPVGDNIVTVSNTYRDVVKTDVATGTTSTIASQNVGVFGGATKTHSVAIGNNTFFYLSGETPEGFDPGIELYTANPTTNEFRLVKDIHSGAQSSYVSDGLAGAVLDNKLIFQAQSSGGFEPWITDGTTAGTFELADLNPAGSSVIPQNFIKVGSKVYFMAEADMGYQLYVTDGTSGGTMAVDGKDNLQQAAAFNNKLIYSQQDGADQIIAITDGTSGGTTELKRFTGGTINALLASNDKAFFVVESSQIWVTDGTSAGTTKVTDNFNINSIGARLKADDGILFFTFNGKMQATRGPADHIVEVGNATPDNELMIAGDFVYFIQKDFTYGKELFRLAIPDVPTGEDPGDDDPGDDDPGDDDPGDDDPVTGIVEDETVNYVYPNPADGHLYVRSNSQASFSILDSTGKQIHGQQLNGIIRIDVSNYGAGMYFLIMKNAGETRVTKFIKR